MSRYGAEEPGIDVEQRNQGWIWSRGTMSRYGAEEPGVDVEQRNHE
jgi:hypothetical protein